jgi:hypothetical protein
MNEIRVLLVYKSAEWIRCHVLPSFARLKVTLDTLDLGHDVGTGAQSPKSLVHGAIIKTSYDLIFLIEGNDALVDCDDLRLAKTRGCVVVNFLVDVPQEWWIARQIASYCDLILVAQKENALRLKRAGNRVLFFPFAVDKEFALRAQRRTSGPATAEPCPIFIGSAHSRWRWRFLRMLDSLQIPVRVYGGGWNEAAIESGSGRRLSPIADFGMGHLLDRIGGGGLPGLIGGVVNRSIPSPRGRFNNVSFEGFLSEDQLGPRLAESSINLSTSVQGSGYLVGNPKRQFKLRDMEFPCFDCGYLTEPNPETVELLGDAVCYYGSEADLRFHLKESIRNPAAYRALAKQASSIILKQHTWESRFDLLEAELAMGAFKDYARVE